MKRSTQHCHGFTLMEMIFVVGMGLFLMLLTSILFTTSTHTIREEQLSKPRINQLDALVATLRADVWAGDALTVVDAGTLQIGSGDRVIDWSQDTAKHQIIRRQAQDQHYHTANLATLGFVQVVGGVEVQITVEGQRDPVVMRLLSRHLLEEAQDAR